MAAAKPRQANRLRLVQGKFQILPLHLWRYTVKRKLRSIRICQQNWQFVAAANFVGCCLPTVLAATADTSPKTDSLCAAKAGFDPHFIQQY